MTKRSTRDARAFQKQNPKFKYQGAHTAVTGKRARDLRLEPDYPRLVEFRPEGHTAIGVTVEGDGMTFDDGSPKLGHHRPASVELIGDEGTRRLDRTRAFAAEVANGLPEISPAYTEKLLAELEKFALEHDGKPPEFHLKRHAVALPMLNGFVNVKVGGLHEPTGRLKVVVDFNGAPDPLGRNMAFVATTVGEHGRTIEPRDQWFVPSSLLAKIPVEKHQEFFVALLALSLEVIAGTTPEPRQVKVGNPRVTKAT